MTASSIRVRERPNPADWEPDAPMRLEEAVVVFGRQLPISVAMLRTEIRKGRLTPAYVAGKFFVTPTQLKDLFKPCPVAPKAPVSTYARDASPGPALGSQTPGSSATERMKSAQAATLMACQQLSGRSPNTSPASGGRTQRRVQAREATPLKSA